MPTGSTIEVTKKEIIILNPDISLKDVLYVPSFKYNLLSISKLTRDSKCCVNFGSNNCLFQDQQLKTILTVGKETKGIYYF